LAVALRNLERALVFYNRGTAFLDLGHYQLAVNDYSEAIRVYHRDAEVYAARAFCYALLGEDGKAQQDVERAVNLGFARTFLERAIEEVKSERENVKNDNSVAPSGLAEDTRRATKTRSEYSGGGES